MKLIDQKAREQALDIRQSFIVQAPAGSGKTELLSNRLLSLLSVVESPEEVLAITFTRKAAAEMRLRVLQRLTQADAIARGDMAMPEDPHQRDSMERALKVLQRDKVQQWQLLAQPGRLRIQTFDSLCSYLVRQIPYLSGMGGALAIQEDASALYREAAQRTLASLEEEHFAERLAAFLLHLDNDGYKAHKLLSEMLARRDQWLPMIGLLHQADADAEWHSRWQQFLSEQLRPVAKLFDRDLQQQLMPLAEYALQELGKMDKAELLVPLQHWQQPLRADARDLALWQTLANWLLTTAGSWRKRLDKNCGFPTGDGEAKRQKQQMSELLEQLAEYDASILADCLLLPSLTQLESQREFVFHLIDVLQLAYAQLQLLFREKAQVDFIEMAAAASQALGEPEAPTDLALALDYRVQHLLVDECQDTSRQQIQLLEKLTAGWQHDDGRTAFLVGDPMQSIYRFRKAEVGEFLRLQSDGLGEVALDTLTLQSNFRSQAALVQWVNALGPDLLANRDDGLRGAVRFASAEAIKPALADAAVQCHGFVNSKEYPKHEAQTVVRLIQQALTDGDQSIAVLGRSRQHLFAIASALRSHGLPFEAVEMEALREHPLIEDLRQLSRALIHPSDRLAWLCVLRAPWCGLTLTDLHALCADVPQRTLRSLINDDVRLHTLSQDGQQRLLRLRAVLQQAETFRGRLRLRARVQHCWMQWQGPELAADAESLIVAEQFFAMLDQIDEQHDDVLAEIDRQLDKLYAQPVGGAAIKLMTMHKSKGLEFDCVILPRLGAKTRADDTPLLRWEMVPIAQGHCLLVGAIQGARDEHAGATDWLKKLEQQRALHESRRLLYVALTRAKKRVHLLGAFSHSKNGFTAASGSLLQALMPHCFQEFTGALQIPEEQPEAITVISDRPMQRLARIEQRSVAISAIDSEALQLQQEDETLGSELSRAIGIVTHGWLEQWSRVGSTDNKPEPALLRKQLRWQQISETDLAMAVERVQTALHHALQDETGRWLLRQQGRQEWALTSEEGELLSRHVIDRSFVADGERWIVDYKTLHSDEDLEAMLNKRVREYQLQLERYASVLRRHETLPLRLALYFPLQQRCYAWRPGQTPERWQVNR
ncbi:UvrD-helicase domain-containing protein [Permianibacter aggregans]|uniref:DNA 3'-5' helicase n=1 Tax=Permianibacter aggregans TaxID=1510150 RepID=A0A4R6UU86_9GAMM|nr:UvrD-helicase domain-containing protein [Permianibacter aggregans]QGX40415.1 nuclease [Permianibacter aggregans]TDQ49449.1 ATP-dependent exoDNAse (exonuclease V) beta subunit [Permianibacter aggregans]